MLSLAIGALQMLLDRGELKDWFGSTEIWIEATIAGLGFYLFVVHTVTADRPVFPEPRSAEGRQLRRRHRSDVLYRHPSLRDDGAGADDAAGPDELPGD